MRPGFSLGLANLRRLLTVSRPNRLSRRLSKSATATLSFRRQLQPLPCPFASDAIKAETSQRCSDPHNTHVRTRPRAHTHMKVISSTSYVWTHVCSGTASTSSPLPPPPPQTPGNCYHIFSPSSCLSFPAGLDLLLMLTLVLSSGFRLLLFPEKLYKKVRRFFEARHNIYTREEDLFSFLFFSLSGRAGVLTLRAAVLSHDAPHDAHDLLADRWRHGRGVGCAVGVVAKVVHQLLRHRELWSVAAASGCITNTGGK